MKTIIFLFCFLIAGCSGTKEDQIDQNGNTEQAIVSVRTEIATNKRASIRYIDSIFLQEDENNYIGLFWNLLKSESLLFIPDWISRDIKVYNENGEMKYIIGRKGGGPGEFMDVRGGIACVNDTLYIIDIMLKRLNMFATDGYYLDSYPLPATIDYTGIAAELLVIDNSIILPIYENKYVPMTEYHKSRTIAFLNKQGDIQNLFGKQPDEYSQFDMYMPSTSITIDDNNNIYQISRASPVIHKYNSRGDLIMRFGITGGNFKEISFNYYPGMPREEIEKLGLKRSYSSTVYWLPSGHIVHGYQNITEESQLKRDPMFHERFLQVYTDDGIHIPSDIPLPGVLLTVDEDGLLYILTDHTPGNRIIDVYELHIEITDE